MLYFKIWPILLSSRWVQIYILEKSNKANNLIFCLCLFFDVYIMHHNVFNVRSAWHRSTVMWSVEWGSSSLALSQASWISISNPSEWSGWSFDQRCSVNLIMRRVTKLNLKFLTLFLQCWHHASQCHQCSVSSMSINHDVVHWIMKLFFGALQNILNLNPLSIWLIREELRLEV